MGIEVFKKHLREKRAIKVSYRAKSINTKNIARFAYIAQISKASAVDLPCGKQFFEAAKKYTKLPIFTSSIHPFEILEAVKYGVDGVEIGNFDSYYLKGQAYNASQIYDIVLETFSLINDYDVFVSVTIPGYILIEDQIKLAKKLQLLGVDMIHIEGLSASNRKYFKDDRSTFANMSSIVENISIPIMATIVSSDIIKNAFVSGINAVEYACVDMNNEAIFGANVMEMVNSVFHRNSINNEILRTSRELVYS